MLTRDTILGLLQKHGASSDAGKLTMGLDEFWKFMYEALTQEATLVTDEQGTEVKRLSARLSEIMDAYVLPKQRDLRQSGVRQPEALDRTANAE